MTVSAAPEDADMPTTRNRRRRPPVQPDVITAIKTGAAVDWSPKNWEMLIDAGYFGDYDLTAAEMVRCRELMDAWRSRQNEHDEAREQRK
jgi:hypothetical protein